VQRDAAFGNFLASAHFHAAQSPGNLYTHPFGTGPHTGACGAFHGPAESDAALQLVGDILGDQLSLELGALDFFDINAHRHTVDLFNSGFKLFGARATAANDDASL